MAKSKRRIPAAVQEQLERKHRQTATLAERQGAALGREARRQLKALTQTKADKSAVALESFAASMQSVRDSFRQAMQSMSISGLWVGGLPASGLYRPAMIPTPPPVDGEKLDALRSAAPYKVVRPAEPQPVVPDLVECLTAWRAWDVVGEGERLRLQALGKEHIWRPRRAMEADCAKASAFELLARRGPVPTHDAPEESCSCGVWSFKELDGLVSALTRYGIIRVLGKVYLWGKVVETENGYRAQYAYPAELWLFNETLEALGHIYNVPVRLVRS